MFCRVLLYAKTVTSGFIDVKFKLSPLPSMLTLKENYNPKSTSSRVIYGLPCTTFGTEVWAPLGPAAATYL